MNLIISSYLYPAITNLSALSTEIKNFFVKKLLNQYALDTLAAVTLLYVIGLCSRAWLIRRS